MCRFSTVGFMRVMFLLALGRACSADELATVVVTATRIAQSSFDLPVSVDVVGRSELSQGQLQENLSEIVC